MPASSTTTTPSAVSSGLPWTIAEAMQLVITNIMPTDRSRPPVSTGRVCAIATSASSTPLLAAVSATGTVSPAE